MRAERVTTGIAVEQRRIDLERQCGGDEQRARRQRVEHEVPGLTRGRRLLGQLLVLLGECRLVSRGRVPVDPFGGIDQRAHLRDACGIEHVGNRDQHAAAPRSIAALPRARNAGTVETSRNAATLATNAAVALAPARSIPPSASSVRPLSPSIRAWLNMPRKSPLAAARA